MNYTENLKLKKPEKNDFALIDDLNDNADALDAAISEKITVSIGETEPTSGPVLWFNTKGYTQPKSQTAIELKLSELSDRAVMNANIEGEEHSVANVNEAKAEDASTYSFEIL